MVISAARYINASSRRIELPLGLGSRHVAAASISRDTQAVAVVVSESSVVRIFDNGRLISEIIPEIRLFSKESFKITGPRKERKVAEIIKRWRQVAIIKPRILTSGKRKEAQNVVGEKLLQNHGGGTFRMEGQCL
jgi:hypothetical protein